MIYRWSYVWSWRAKATGEFGSDGSYQHDELIRDGTWLGRMLTSSGLSALHVTVPDVSWTMQALSNTRVER